MQDQQESGVSLDLFSMHTQIIAPLPAHMLHGEILSHMASENDEYNVQLEPMHYLEPSDHSYLSQNLVSKQQRAYSVNEEEPKSPSEIHSLLRSMEEQEENTIVIQDVSEQSSVQALVISEPTKSEAEGSSSLTEYEYFGRKRLQKQMRKAIEIYQHWTDEEHQKAVKLVRQFGKQWQVIKEEFPNRTADQLKAHLYKVRNKIRHNPEMIGLLGQKVYETLEDTRKTPTKLYKPWTQAEHKQCVELLHTHGKKWQHIQKEFPNRSAAQLRSHLQKVCNKIRNDPTKIQLLGQNGQEVFDMLMAK